MSKPRVVITGAAGSIGSHLAESLLDLGYSVVGIDNLLLVQGSKFHTAGRPAPLRNPGGP